MGKQQAQNPQGIPEPTNDYGGGYEKTPGRAAPLTWEQYQAGPADHNLSEADQREMYQMTQYSPEEIRTRLDKSTGKMRPPTPEPVRTDRDLVGRIPEEGMPGYNSGIPNIGAYPPPPVAQPAPSVDQPPVPSDPRQPPLIPGLQQPGFQGYQAQPMTPEQGGQWSNLMGSLTPKKNQGGTTSPVHRPENQQQPGQAPPQQDYGWQNQQYQQQQQQQQQPYKKPGGDFAAKKLKRGVYGNYGR